MKRGPKPFQFGDRCRRGHQLTPATVAYEKGRMRCRLCRRINKADSYRSNPEVRKRDMERARWWYWQHTDRAKDTRRAYYEANRAAIYAYKKQWKLNNPERVKSYWERDREKLFAKWRAWAEAQVRELGDSYIRTCLRVKDAPQELIKAKRVYLRDYYRPTRAFKKFLGMEIANG
jgi:hypothetical protein